MTMQINLTDFSIMGTLALKGFNSQPFNRATLQNGQKLKQFVGNLIIFEAIFGEEP